MGGQRRTISAAQDELKQRPRLTLTEQVFAQLRAETLRGELRPGETVNEPDLAERYGVSKTPVREALRLMVQDGWVVSIPSKGYLIRPMALDDIREIYALRAMLEPTLSAGAARRRSDADVAALRTILRRQSGARDFEQMIEFANEFHARIASLSGNARAEKVLHRLFDEVKRLMFLMPRLEGDMRSSVELEAHDAILTAIENRNADGAATLMKAHLVAAGRGVARAFVDGA
jgi:GntR family transcriptional regulator, rspAB operon transcriptional repressor